MLKKYIYIVSLKNHMTSVVTGNIRVISNQIIVFAVLPNHLPALAVHVHVLTRMLIVICSDNVIKGVGPPCTLSL